MAKIVRTKNVVEILEQLKFIPKKTAHIFSKVIASAAANATNNAGYDLKDLFVQNVDVGRGPKIKRFRMVAKGSGHGYIKHRAFVRVTLGVK